MLHTVVIDAEALDVLAALFHRNGGTLPRSAIVDRRHGVDWHAIPIDAASITAILNLRYGGEPSFNDLLRDMLDLPPLNASVRSVAARQAA